MLKEKSLCTMLSSIELCKIPSTSYKSKYKWPKLTELHTTLYGESFDNAHNAFADIMATKKCFM
jgi:DNA polymerase-3 subunit alpha